MTDCTLTLLSDGDVKTYTCRKCKRKHESKYPPELIHRNCTVQPCNAKGPGTELERILKWFRLKVKRGCGCEDFIRWMNSMGPDGCRQNIASIVDKLRTEARKRFPWRWVFRPWAGKLLILWAIRRAERL